MTTPNMSHPSPLDLLGVNLRDDSDLKFQKKNVKLENDNPQSTCLFNVNKKNGASNKSLKISLTQTTK